MGFRACGSAIKKVSLYPVKDNLSILMDAGLLDVFEYFDELAKNIRCIRDLMILL
jgi:hypothetical protein